MRNPIQAARSFIENKRREFEAELRAEEGQFECYRTLAALARSEHSMLLSREAQEEYEVELARLRAKFKDDPRARIIDPLGFAEQPA